MNIGKAVRLCRHQKGLTQAQLAEMSGLSVSFLSMLEKGRRDPSLSSIQSIASALEVPVSILVFLGADNEDLVGMSQELTEKLSSAALRLVQAG